MMSNEEVAKEEGEVSDGSGLLTELSHQHFYSEENHSGLKGKNYSPNLGPL